MVVLLYDELQKLAQQKGISIKKPKKKLVGKYDENWEKCKKTLMGFSSDIEGVIKRAFERGVLKISKGEKYIRYEVDMGKIYGFPVSFIAYEIRKGENAGKFKYAWYAAFNMKTSTCFRANLISDEDEELYRFGVKVFGG